MSKIKDLNELCQMSEAKLTEVIENSKNAKLIYEFLNKTVKDINLFDKELDFEDLNEFFEAEKKNKTDQLQPGKAKSKKAEPKKGIVKKKTTSKNK